MTDMYESPIKLFESAMESYLEGETLKAVMKVGVSVDKEELLRALQYDREQYQKGYKDAIDEYMNLLCEHCMLQKNSCDECECPFCSDDCDLIRIAEKLRDGDLSGKTSNEE